MFLGPPPTRPLDPMLQTYWKSLTFYVQQHDDKFDTPPIRTVENISQAGHKSSSHEVWHCSFFSKYLWVISVSLKIFYQYITYNVPILKRSFVNFWRKCYTLGFIPVKATSHTDCRYFRTPRLDTVLSLIIDFFKNLCSPAGIVEILSVYNARLSRKRSKED